MASKTLYDVPGVHRANGFVPALAALDDASETHPIFTAPCKCIVTRISLVPQAAATGDDTATRHFNIINKGSAGIGSTEITALDLATGINLVAFDEKVVSAALTTELAEGDVLALQNELIGGGLATPNMLVAVDFKANPAGV